MTWKDFSGGININEDTYNVDFAINKNKILVSFLYNSLWYYDLNEITGVAGRNKNTVDNFILLQNYPNPFNILSRISYSIPKPCHVTIKIYDLLGNEITTLVQEKQQPGKYNIPFKAINISSGVYFYRMQAGDFNKIKKFILLK
ncbi:MAG: T9SS type A sorting domain-containing protein [Ignavibacteriaceae bacterium]